MNTPGLLRLQSVHKTYRQGLQVVQALQGVDLALRPGGMLALTGPSGNGKCSLLSASAWRLVCRAFRPGWPTARRVAMHWPGRRGGNRRSSRHAARLDVIGARIGNLAHLLPAAQVLYVEAVDRQMCARGHRRARTSDPDVAARTDAAARPAAHLFKGL